MSSRVGSVVRAETSRPIRDQTQHILSKVANHGYAEEERLIIFDWPTSIPNPSRMDLQYYAGSWLRIKMSTVQATLRVLGILLGSLSLISLAQFVLNVGLVPTLEELITFYRSLAANVIGLLTALFGFIPPQPVLDF
jgi:hypothetical protein